MELITELFIDRYVYINYIYVYLERERDLTWWLCDGEVGEHAW